MGPEEALPPAEGTVEASPRGEDEDLLDLEDGISLREEEEEEVDLGPEFGGLGTRGARTLVPWPVDILDLLDPPENEPLVMGSRERHGTCLPRTAPPQAPGSGLSLRRRSLRRRAA